MLQAHIFLFFDRKKIQLCTKIVGLQSQLQLAQLKWADIARSSDGVQQCWECLWRSWPSGWLQDSWHFWRSGRSLRVLVGTLTQPKLIPCKCPAGHISLFLFLHHMFKLLLNADVWLRFYQCSTSILNYILIIIFYTSFTFANKFWYHISLWSFILVKILHLTFDNSRIHQ